MSQLNINLNPAFEEALTELMTLRSIKTKSEAIRLAVQEAVTRSRQARCVADFEKWLGLANKAPLNPNPRFGSDDDLWR